MDPAMSGKATEVGVDPTTAQKAAEGGTDPATTGKAVDPPPPEAAAMDPSAKPPGKATPTQRGMHLALYKAATQGNVASLKKLVAEDLDILSSTTPQINTALHLAALHGNSKFAREVLDKSEDLLLATNDDGDTPLHLAGKAKVLVRRGEAYPGDSTTTVHDQQGGQHPAARGGKGAQERRGDDASGSRPLPRARSQHPG
ncbi:hypothetical protein BAE44_0013102 [Dichanthelium oligosanthes]|uniref:Uncharacterized protein n=1 Tax=Dichanthelium oligosanthes TaxID=888268 RepID=A0A1E5VL97_9POAL|nr:hypothetical protein BAE44_0013102 [Dichanthelium oligosanthes]